MDSTTLIISCIVVLFVGTIGGFALGFVFFAWRLSKDRSIVRLRENEVVIPKAELDHLIKNMRHDRKRSLLQGNDES